MMSSDGPFDGIDVVIADSLRFKAKLAIGEDAYTSLRYAKTAQEWWDMLGAVGSGAAVAKSSAVAATFFAPQGLLGILGIGAAVTPVGWVIVAALASGGAWYGIQKTLAGANQSRVTVIPKFINTPIDALAVSLFDLLAPLALKVAQCDGDVAPTELGRIKHYFVREWGFDETFTQRGIEHILPNIAAISIQEVAQQLAVFQRSNPDCNYTAMSHDTLAFLREIVEADGQLHEQEELALSKVRAILDETGRSALSKTLSKVGDKVSKSAAKRAHRISEGARLASDTARELGDAVSRSSAITHTKTLLAIGTKGVADVAKATAERSAKRFEQLTRKSPPKNDDSEH